MPLDNDPYLDTMLKQVWGLGFHFGLCLDTRERMLRDAKQVFAFMVSRGIEPKMMYLVANATFGVVEVEFHYGDQHKPLIFGALCAAEQPTNELPN